MTHLVRVSSSTYELLHKLAGRLQTKKGRKVSLDEAMGSALNPEKQENKAKSTRKTTKTDPLKPFSMHEHNKRMRARTQPPKKQLKQAESAGEELMKLARNIGKIKLA